MKARVDGSWIALFAAAAVALSACGKKAEEAATAKPEQHQVSVEKGSSIPEDHPELGELTIASRAPRRLSVDQLERSLDAIGNLPPGSMKIPGALAATLGRPDFLRVTEESLEPSPLFMKFMVDVGAFACGALADLEQTRSPRERLMTRTRSVDTNLRFMLLRFTGIAGPEAEQYLPRLRVAYDRGALAPTRPLGGYEAVCLALFTSPEFLLY